LLKSVRVFGSHLHKKISATKEGERSRAWGKRDVEVRWKPRRGKVLGNPRVTKEVRKSGSMGRDRSTLKSQRKRRQCVQKLGGCALPQARMWDRHETLLGGKLCYQKKKEPRKVGKRPC